MKGFTLVELIVSVSIFVMMTVLLVIKYGNFNQSVLLTNLAYDTALALRTAQTYGLSVVNTAPSGATNAQFQNAYGVNFSKTDNTKIRLYADGGPTGIPDGVYGGSDILESTYNITRGAVISGLCTGTAHDSCTSIVAPATELNISFKRPDPQAIICVGTTACDQSSVKKYAEITITGTDGSTRTVAVSANGQISVLQ